MSVLGIDIGGSGIKGNLVDVDSGTLLAERFKIETPRPSTPDAVAEAVSAMVRHFGHRGLVGCTFPAVVRRGVALTAANVDRAWIGTDVDALFEARTGQTFHVFNDADAAAVAEMEFGAGRERRGVVLVLTFGTGIGSGMFVDGVLVPNTELGHMHLDRHSPVESWAAARVKDAEGLSWEEWAGRVDRFLAHLDRVFSPDLFILGGGVSRKWDQWGHVLSTPVETVPAALENEAGIVGAALAASRAE
ncbi:MAG TPA: ROK family protein [Acidimicrobiia bacterium]|nr:ROK family protein [Acidimicrobiia bacterium]